MPAVEVTGARKLTRRQRIARTSRWVCDGVVVLLGIVAFVDLVGGEGAQGWLFLLFSGVAFAIGQIIRRFVKGSDGWPRISRKAKMHRK